MKTKKLESSVKFIKLVFVFFALILTLHDAKSIPFPQGIDGIVYELDSVTEVPSGIDFFVQNENTGKVIYGKTGHGSKGRYSATISGNFEDTIIVKAWNKYNQVNISLLLNGVMHNVHLYLNMTFPPIEPTITTLAPAEAFEDQAYIYDMDAFDENKEDILQFYLSSFPEGMSIDNYTGLITWIPRGTNVGINSVVAHATDGIFIINQSFSILVHDVNDQPQITSSPITVAMVGKDYVYDVDAIDEEDSLTYKLRVYPKGMVINNFTGLIKWYPSKKQTGDHRVIVEASDGTLSASQEFTIHVLSQKNIKSSSGSAMVPIVFKNNTVIAVKLSEEAQINVDELPGRPDNVALFNRKVYKYLSIENIDQNEINGHAEINFSVNLKWLKDNKLSENAIVMTRFTKSGWQDLQTLNVSKDKKYVYYTTITPGFSIFAISIKEGIEVQNIVSPEISKIDVPYRIYGTVYKFLMMGQAKEGSLVKIKNLRTNKISSITTDGINPGTYYIFVEGNKGDDITLSINDIDQEYTTKLDDIENLNFMLNFRASGFVPITGNIFISMIRESYWIITMILIVLGLVAFRVISLKRRRGK